MALTRLASPVGARTMGAQTNWCLLSTGDRRAFAVEDHQGHVHAGAISGDELLGLEAHQGHPDSLGLGDRDWRKALGLKAGGLTTVGHGLRNARASSPEGPAMGSRRCMVCRQSGSCFLPMVAQRCAAAEVVSYRPVPTCALAARRGAGKTHTGERHLWHAFDL